MCPTKKRAYPKRKWAKKALIALLQLGVSRVGKLHVYRCEICGDFHIGNRKPWLISDEERARTKALRSNSSV